MRRFMNIVTLTGIEPTMRRFMNTVAVTGIEP